MFQQVVLVDDSKLANKVTSRILDAYSISHEVSVFTEATEALDFFNAYNPNEQPAKRLVLLDIHMPGMDGFSFLEEFSKLNPAQQRDWKIYMLSSSISPNDIKRAENHPLVEGYVMKPLTGSFFDQFKS